jgi:signal peptide peptidase SppA
VKDYARVLTKICSTPWLITPEGLGVVLSIFQDRVANGRLSDEELAVRLQDFGGGEPAGDIHPANGVGILSLAGPIFGKANLMTEMSGATSLEMFREDFRTMMNDGNIHSIVLDIDSPGGTSDLVQEVGDEIFAARDDKSIHAIANTMAGSAAYWLMSQASAAYATPSAMVGSVGAYTVHKDQSESDRQQGNKFTFISAGPFKTEGNPHEPITQEGKEYRQGLIDELYGDFVSAVAAGRRTDGETVIENFGGGRMVNPKTALESGMIDGITSFDALVSNIANRPRKVSVVLSNGNKVSGYLSGTDLHLESKEWEHSAPGTGTPPLPRKDEDGSDDPAITSKSRRSPLPMQVGEPGAPSPNPSPPKTNVNNITISREGDNGLTPEEETRFRSLLGLGPNDSIFDAVQTMANELGEIRASVSAASQEAQFSQQYPAVWAEHQSLLDRDRENTARTFASSVTNITRVEGNDTKPSGSGLSSLAIEQVTEAHKKFAQGTGTLEDYENSIKVITQGGIVPYGEAGSSRQHEVQAVDTSSPTGIASSRKMFAAKVAEIQVSDSLELKAAINEAAKRYPDLARAYQATSNIS